MWENQEETGRLEMEIGKLGKGSRQEKQGECSCCLGVSTRGCMYQEGSMREKSSPGWQEGVSSWAASHSSSSGSLAAARSPC